MPTPRVTVLLPVYNGAATIDQAVQSILIQTFSDFEFLIVDDGSTDDTVERLATYRDPRLRVERRKNGGVGAALRFGVEASRGEFIARMDADDISAPNRLERQVTVLENVPEVGLVHALVYYMDKDGRALTGHQPDPGNQTMLHRWRLLWQNVVMHSTVMMRRSVLEKAGLNYRDGCLCEDYDLWSRMLFHTDFMRVNEYLLWYRMHPGSASAKFGEAHVETISQIRRETLGRILGEPLDEDCARDLSLLSGQTWLRPEEYEPRTSTKALGALMARVLDRFPRTFPTAVERMPRLRRDAARQLLDWAWLLDRCPTPPPDGHWAMVRAALELDPFTLISRKFLRHLVAVTLGPAWLKRINEARRTFGPERRKAPRAGS